jgi:hypothetical protein
MADKNVTDIHQISQKPSNKSVSSQGSSIVSKFSHRITEISDIVTSFHLILIISTALFS